MSRLQIVACMSGIPREDYFCWREFFASLRRFGHEPLIIGTQPGEFKGMASKPKLLKKAIEAGAVAADYTLFSDVFDVVFQLDPLMAIDLMTPDFPVAISAEKNCFPDTSMIPAFDAMCPDMNEKSSPFRYLNSGFILAKTDALLTLLNSLDLENVLDDYRKPDGTNHHGNDQELMQHAFLKQPQAVPMRLDYYGAFSQTMHRVSKEEINFLDGGRISNWFGIMPVSIHFNGDAKTSGLQEPILKHLGLR